ncbi:hypothetical protein NM688_g7646 [Phlebia brevispora]|uniref:Uncharacterized protein n=1 Tax=Phlebia brevispora TaxID=194682 RepID=A0ACC1S2Z6_9APHY|nr:hypothetical protein NM688_g7646 [Phlebia brevispora]
MRLSVASHYSPQVSVCVSHSHLPSVLGGPSPAGLIAMLIRSIASFLLVFIQWFDTARAQGNTSLWTSWVPLAVRSPYLSCWMDTTKVLSTVWPVFLQSGENLGWAGFIRIDAKRTFIWLGSPLSPSGLNKCILTNIQITPTRTIMNMTAGPLDLTVTFLSPIEPANPVLQSLPFSYVSLSAVANDGQAHSVQVYSDISGEWVSGNRTAIMNWVDQTTDTIVYHQVFPQNPQAFTEISNQAEDADIYLAQQTIANQSSRTDTDANCRGQFQASGTLTATSSFTGPTPIQTPFPVFAIATDLGTISATTDPVVWGVGLTRDPAIAYIGEDGTEQQRSPYWRSQFGPLSDISSVQLTSFIQDYPNAIIRAIALDEKILSDAANVSAHYADLVSLAARQALGGIELTVGQSSVDSTQLNTSDVKMFMKNVAADGRVSPVEGLYSAFPFFLYVNATWAGHLLEPVLEFANSPRWVYPYAPHDIGINYPNATGNSNSHSQGVEQSGNMLIMSLAHARATGDGNLINRFYPLLKTWGDYLVNNSLPLATSQISVDSTETNLTNLALKGIIGIKAMSEISAALNITNDAQHFANVSSIFAQQWQAQALSTDHQHVLTSFGDPDSSSALTYNLFADRLLNTNVIQSGLYTLESAFLKTETSSSNGGVPVDTGLPGQANTAWSMFAAGYVTDPSVRQTLVDQIWGYVSSNSTNNGIFPIVYNITSGAGINPGPSPFIGGVFAPLSLNVPSEAIAVPPPNSSTSTSQRGSGSQPGPRSRPASASASPKKSSHVGAIIGDVVGGISGATIFLIMGFVLYGRRRRGLESADRGSLSLVTEPVPVPLQLGPLPAKPRSRVATQFSALKVIRSRHNQPLASGLTDASASAPASNLNAPSEAHLSPSPAASSGPASAGVLRLDVLYAEIQHLRQMMQSLREVQYGPPPRYEPAAMDTT